MAALQHADVELPQKARAQPFMEDFHGHLVMDEHCTLQRTALQMPQGAGKHRQVALVVHMAAASRVRPLRWPHSWHPWVPRLLSLKADATRRRAE
jgi:hypothetical protein